MFLDPSPVPNCQTFSDPLPLERDVLYGRPNLNKQIIKVLMFLIWLIENEITNNLWRSKVKSM